MNCIQVLQSRIAYVPDGINGQRERNSVDSSVINGKAERKMGIGIYLDVIQGKD